MTLSTILLQAGAGAGGQGVALAEDGGGLGGHGVGGVDQGQGAAEDALGGAGQGGLQDGVVRAAEDQGVDIGVERAELGQVALGDGDGDGVVGPALLGERDQQRAGVLDHRQRGINGMQGAHIGARAHRAQGADDADATALAGAGGCAFLAPFS